MPVIRFNAKDLERLIGKQVPDRKKLAADIPLIGADVESAEGDDWAVEFFPDRPDLFTVEGIARALRQLYGIEPGLKQYRLAPGTDTLHVDPSVKEVRPFIAAAIVEGVEITERRLQAIIDLQEDLHWGLGARRRRVAIGIHDASALQGPYRYAAVDPKSVSFVPLQSEEKMTMEEVLLKHPKGKDYAHLVTGHAKGPLITDAKQQVLSFPPIINGRLTTVTTATKKIFLDVTGTQEWAVHKALNLLVTMFLEEGATVRPVKIEGAYTATTPDLAPERRTLAPEAVNKLLGTRLAAPEIANHLQRLGFGATVKGDHLEVLVPPYRVDVMHEVDLIEDVAIGVGLMNLEPDLPHSVTSGNPLPGSLIMERARQSLIGYGFLEIVSLSLSNDRDQFEKLNMPTGWAVRVKNPVTEDHTQLRTSLLPSLLAVLRKNAHRDLPQQLFEVGVVTVEGPQGQPDPRKHVAAVLISAKAGFSDVKGLLQGFARDMGWNLTVEAADHPAFTPGRCAAVKVDGERVGHFGEVHPQVLEHFGLGYPTVAFEVRLATPPSPLP